MGKSAGSSLIQVIVSLGVLGVVSSVFSSMIFSMSTNQKALGQKLELVMLGQQIVGMLNNSANCDCQFNAPTYVFDSNLPAADARIDGIANLRVSCAPGAPELVIRNAILPGSLSGLSVQEISLTNIQSTGNPDEIISDLMITMNPNSTPLALKPLVIPGRRFQLDPASPPNAKRILSCAGAQMGGGVFVAVDRKAAGVAGGPCTPDSWITRTLNTVNLNTISGAALVGNRISLPAGTYTIWARSPAGDNTDEIQAKLVNVTDGVDQVIGTSDETGSSSGSTTGSFVVGAFTIASPKLFGIRHICDSSGPEALGEAVAENIDPAQITAEIYTVVQIRKED